LLTVNVPLQIGKCTPGWEWDPGLDKSKPPADCGRQCGEWAKIISAIYTQEFQIQVASNLNFSYVSMIWVDPTITKYYFYMLLPALLFQCLCVGWPSYYPTLFWFLISGLRQNRKPY